MIIIILAYIFFHPTNTLILLTPMKDYDPTPFIIDGGVQYYLKKYLDWGSAKKLSLCNKTLKENLVIPSPFLPWQYPHFKNLRDSINKWGRGFDTSETGLGKTYVTCILYLSAQNRNPNSKLIIFGPSIVKQSWENATKYYGIRDWEFHTYTEFRRKQKPFLTYDPARDQWVPDIQWLLRVNTGCFLVLDEAHHLKNKSNQTNYATQLTQSLFRYGIREGKRTSSLLMLSATPMDKPEHARQTVQLLGLLPYNYKDLSDPETSLIQTNFRRIFGKGYSNGNGANPISSLNFNSVYDWLSHGIKPIIYFHMPPQPKKSEVTNFFADVGQDIHAIRAGVNALHQAIQQQLPNNHIISILKNIECGKSRTFVAKAKEQLDRDPNCKVIILMNFLEPIDYLKQQLQKYQPEVIIGEVKVEQRYQVIRNFQKHNNEHRLLIGNVSILANGVDLDDTNGKYPRYLFISPSYYLINLHQAKGRVDRGNTKSKAQVRYLYAKGVEREVGLLDILATKSNTLKDFLDYQVSLPGDHPMVIEDAF